MSMSAGKDEIKSNPHPACIAQTNKSRNMKRIHCKHKNGGLGRYAKSTFYCCLLLPMLATLEVSAKIRIPNSFVSGDSPQDNHAIATTGVETEAVQDIDNDYDILFQNWITNNWSDGARQQDNPSPTATASAKSPVSSGRRYGFPLSSFKFASLTSQEYLARIEKRLKRLQDFYNKTQELLGRGLVIFWKITNDVVRYKFPVGIVSAYSAVVVVSKILKIQDKRRNKKQDNAGQEGDESTQEETPDTYKYVLRHTGRALDLDADDLTSYRHLGGIEQVRSRLLRSALSEGVQRRNRNAGETERENEKEKLSEALLAALSMEFVPGGSHSEYIRDMIPSFSKAEECAHKLRIAPVSVAAPEGRSTNFHRGSHHPYHTLGDVEDNVSTENNDETRLFKMALQTAEIRIIDSKLRSIRDRFLRTTYRLDRTVKYWKSKIESERLSSSLITTTTTGSWKRFALFSSSPIQRLKMRWSRLFSFGSGGGKNAASVHNNPNFVHNSLLEGDRMRLAFAEAAYKAEIVRLGKVLNLLGRRPEEMPDSTLTNALVEQQQERRRQNEEELLERQNLEKLMQVGDKVENEEKERVSVNKNPTPWNQIRSVAANIAKNLDRNKKIATPAPVEKQNAAVALLQPFKSVSQTISVHWAQQWNRAKLTKPKRNKFFAIRFNADGRGKFSLQTYDEGSVAIEGDTAKRLLLLNYDDCQKPWLEETNAWALEARGLIVDTIRESVEASIHPVSSNSRSVGRVGGIGGSTYNDGAAATHNGLDELESSWRVRKYVDQSNDGTANDETDDASAEKQSALFPALLSSKQASTLSSNSIPHRQWMFVYEMHRDINRLKRVGEGRSLKFKWKEVHWIHWLMQWNLVGLPSAALKIWVAAWIHDKSKPYVPKVQDVSREAYVATVDFIMTRFWTPFKDLVDELINRKKGLVTGVSLDEEEASLDTMLSDLGLGDGTPATRHEATIKATRQYESYMKSGLMMHALGGRLARLMLIQVQQLKVSMLDAAETIDVLFESNKINMQLMALIPAFGVFYVGAKIFVRFLFSIRAKDLRPITSVHAEMTDYLNELESNIILRKGGGGGQEKGAIIQQFDDSNGTKSSSLAMSGEEEETQQLGEFALTLYNYLLLLDQGSPQPFSNRQCDVIHRSLTTFLGRNGSFGRDGVTVDGQSRLLDLVKGKHQELSKFL